VTDHNVQQTLRVCDRAYIIDDGKKFAEGTPRELINNEMVRRVYLGSLFRGDEFDDLPERNGRAKPIVVARNGVNGHAHASSAPAVRRQAEREPQSRASRAPRPPRTPGPPRSDV